MEWPGSRLSKSVFIGTSSTFLAVCLGASAIRLYMRFCIQKQFGWDDGFLLFGLCCLVSGAVIIYTVCDLMYEVQRLVYTDPAELDFRYAMSMLPKTLKLRKAVTVALTLMWCSICCVKFAFLALFKHLVRRMPAMTRYWYFTVAFNVAIFLYGGTVYAVGCPYFTENNIAKTVQCMQGSFLKLALGHATAQMVLDIAGDIFILIIPIILIWKIRTKWTQKLALALTLCLTIVMIAITTLRIIGLKRHGKLDYIWEIYFTAIAAEIGLTLVAMTAFRALYVSRTQGEHVKSPTAKSNWNQKGRASVPHIASEVTGHSNSQLDNMEMDNTSEVFVNNNTVHEARTGLGNCVEINGGTVADTEVGDTESPSI